ncbi:hypothetical protein F5887DRAFT_1071080 [Amanita rubescens]|nr:hypothetical protein F5887DRAFT_1071080 [Amanita rubescens]
MSELQSSAAFHLYKDPLHRSGHIVLPPSLMYGEDARTFWCAVYGSPIPFEISVHVNGLKKDIIKEIALRDVAYSSLVLLEAEPVNPEKSLWQRIRKRGDVEMFTKELTDSTQEITTPSQKPCLHSGATSIQSSPAIIHHKLWGEHEFFGKIFRTANLTEQDFKGLQDLLDVEGPGRTSDSYVAKDVLANKSDFLRKKSELTQRTIFLIFSLNLEINLEMSIG